MKMTWFRKSEAHKFCSRCGAPMASITIRAKEPSYDIETGKAIHSAFVSWGCSAPRPSWGVGLLSVHDGWLGSEMRDFEIVDA